MTQKTINVSSTRDAVREIISSLPEEFSSGGTAVVDVVLRRVGTALLRKIEAAFVVKSRGGTDEAGDRWEPLKPRTVAYSRVKRGKRESARDTRPSQGLTKVQQARWWELYRQGLAIHKGNKASAAKRAWAIVKGEGARTLIDRYGNTRVLILHVTGQLLRSLTPESGSSDQILEVSEGGINIGTKRQGAMAHHYGSPSRGLPQRRLWPETNRWPDSWWQDIIKEVQQGLVEALTENLNRGM